MVKYLLYRFRWWLADHTAYLPKAPINLDLELAGKCQLSCTMCPYGLGTFDESKQGMMPLEMAERALQEARAIGVKAIKLNFRGEPGLSKHLVPLINYAKALGFVDVFINTNLLAFSDSRLRQLVNSDIDKIIVSIDGCDKETYEKVRVGGDFDKLVKNIRKLSVYRGFKLKPKIILQMVSEEPDERLYDLPADGYRFVKVQDRGQGIGKKTSKRRRCPQPRQRLVIGWDGTIFACCSNWGNEYPLGNYNEISLLDAWHGSKMQTLREISTKCDDFPCKDCQVSGSYK